MAEIIDMYHPNRGDTWDAVAYREMGDEYYIQDLMDANPKYHGIAVFDGTEVLNIPDVSDDNQETQAPWRT